MHAAYDDGEHTTLEVILYAHLSNFSYILCQEGNNATYHLGCVLCSLLFCFCVLPVESECIQ
jgi:hypothetical protein